jgi:DNA-binding CsgD family transcriptional regulator
VSVTACVGRDQELTALIRRSQATATTGADLIAVVGARGIGKSVLLRRLTEQLPALVWWSHAVEWESAVAGGVLRQLLQEDVPDTPVEAAAVVVDRITSTPVLAVVDDVEHADTVSVQALMTVVRRHRDLPLLVVFACSEPDWPTTHDIADMVHLGGLGPTAMAELAALRGRSLHPAMADVLTQHVSGNPRDALALLDQLPESVWSQPDSRLPAPAHIVADVRDRLTQCAPAGRALVESLAILGDDESLHTVMRLAGLADPLGAIDDAYAAGLLAAAPDYQPRLRNPLVRAAVIDLMGVRAASSAHRRAAETVDDPVRRLHHQVAATPLPDSALADEVEVLARDRSTQGAWAEAARLFRDASRLSPDAALRTERLTKSVDALVAAGDCAGAAALLPAIESSRETPLRNAVLGYLAIVRGRAAEADVRLHAAWDNVDADREPETAALIAQRLVLHSLARCRGKELVQWADRAVALAGDDSPAALEAAAIRGLGLSACGQFDEAVASYDELSRRIRHGAQAQRITMGRGWLQLSRDDIDGARSSLEGAIAMAALGGSARITLWSLGWLARVQFLTGEWDRALHTVERGQALAASTAIALATPLLSWTAAHVYALRGDWAAASATLCTADKVVQDYQLMQIPMLLARGHVAEAEADYAKVRAALTPLTPMTSGTVLREPGLWPWADLMASALVVDGQLDTADSFLRRHEEFAHGHRSATARLRAARGRLLGAQSDLPAARHAFEEALTLLDGLPLRYELARVNFSYGQMLRRAGKRRDADAVINTARELYLSLGATTFVERCERELRAGGLHQTRGSRPPVELTPQENAVTSLVAQGLSNREVAAQLYVSPKTVQYHLTRIYAKLGVRSRAELAATRR